MFFLIVNQFTCSVNIIVNVDNSSSRAKECMTFCAVDTVLSDLELAIGYRDRYEQTTHGHRGGGRGVMVCQAELACLQH